MVGNTGFGCRTTPVLPGRNRQQLSCRKSQQFTPPSWLIAKRNATERHPVKAHKFQGLKGPLLQGRENPTQVPCQAGWPPAAWHKPLCTPSFGNCDKKPLSSTDSLASPTREALMSATTPYRVDGDFPASRSSCRYLSISGAEHVTVSIWLVAHHDTNSSQR